MYNSQIVAERIKKKASENNIALGNMFAELGISNNTLHNMKTSMPKSDTLARIADYLNVSVDYLLGRTDNPNINDNSIKPGDVKGINVKGDTSVTISETPKEHDTIKQNFIALFDNLSPENQIEVMYFTKQLMEKES